jgi:glycosyltransferase involved in cell wall biosynthesis
MVRALKVRGSYHDSTGYDHHTRSVVRELLRRGVEVELTDSNGGVSGTRSPKDFDPSFDTLRSAPSARTLLHIFMPQYAFPQPGLFNVVHTMFEATPVHSSWVAMTRAHDLLLVPTESSRQAWVAGGMPEDQIRLCPLGVDADLYGPPAVPLPLRRDNGVPVAEYRTRFLNVSAIGSRKNVTGLMRAWMRATSRDDDAILILKIGYYYPGDYAFMRAQIAEAERQLGRRIVDAAPIHGLFDILPVASMPRLYAAATHYISMSYGEGWDFPMVEAAASGLRLIAPWHSAYMHYLDGATAQLIPSRRVPTRFFGDPYLTSLFVGAEWWDPDEDAAVGLIRAAIDGREVPKASPRERILRELSWERSVSRLVSIVDELESQHS